MYQSRYNSLCIRKYASIQLYFGLNDTGKYQTDSNVFSEIKEHRFMYIYKTHELGLLLYLIHTVHSNHF